MIHALGLPTILAALFVAIFLQGDNWTLTAFGVITALSIAGYYGFYRLGYRLCCNGTRDEGHRYYYSFVVIAQLLFWWAVIASLFPDN